MKFKDVNLQIRKCDLLLMINELNPTEFKVMLYLMINSENNKITVSMNKIVSDTHVSMITVKKVINSLKDNHWVKITKTKKALRRISGKNIVEQKLPTNDDINFCLNL